MNFNSNSILKPSSGFRYKEKSIAGELERYMAIKGIVTIGNFPVEERPHPRSLDLELHSRAWRTLWLKDLSFSEVGILHRYEWEKCPRLLFGSEAFELLKKTEKKYPLSKDKIQKLIKFNDDHRPMMDRNLDGYKIPPYFIDDLEFDGMEYHHAWDKSVWHTPGPDLFAAPENELPTKKRFRQ